MNLGGTVATIGFPDIGLQGFAPKLAKGEIASLSGAVDDPPWASGTVVRIEPVDEQTPTLFETLKDFDGMAGDLPADLAVNLDPYVHGYSRP